MDPVSKTTPSTPPPPSSVGSSVISSPPSPVAPKLAPAATDTRTRTAMSGKPPSAAVQRARQTQAAASAAFVKARNKIQGAAGHPAAARLGSFVTAQIGKARQMLGRSETVLHAEKLMGVDRVQLVVIFVILFVLLIPLDMLGVALPATTALCYVRPAFHSILALEGDKQEDVPFLLSYFIILGMFQTVESLAPRLLVKTIPHYPVVKLLLLAYLGHPRLKGAAKVHDVALKRLVPAPPTTVANAPIAAAAAATARKPARIQVPTVSTKTGKTSTPVSPIAVTIDKTTSSIPVPVGATRPRSISNLSNNTGATEVPPPENVSFNHWASPKARNGYSPAPTSPVQPRG